MFGFAAAFLLLSGVASLTYQVVWVRLLGLSMGSTSASISTVLAAFFMGLALGSYLAERITRNRIDSLRPYIVLEIIIGLSGLALLPGLLNLDTVMATLPVLGGAIPAKFAVTMALLAIPTVCMGATFPVMASIIIRRRSEVGVRMSQLYSLNTAGAVLGAALAGFVFVPHWGLNGAVYIAFSINLLIVLAGLYLNRRLTLSPLESASAASTAMDAGQQATEEVPLRGRALVVLFATGLVAIATEVGWTKYLSIFTGTTIYGFAAILTVFLLGIAAGSWVIRTRLDGIRRPEVWMAFGLILLGGALLLTRAGLTLVPPVYEMLNHFNAATWMQNSIKYAFVFILLFPPTFLFGALFPLNLKLYCGNLQGVRARIGKAYAVNTVASILGSVVAGFWIIPTYGTDVLLTVMAIILLLLPFLFVPVLQAPLPRFALAAFILATMVSGWLLPHLDYKDLITSVQYDDEAFAGKEPDYLYLQEGKAGVISMVTFDGRHVKLQNNGLNESFIDLEDGHNVLLAETLLGLVPYMMHEEPKSAFVVGFGGGVTTKALTLSQLESIRVVELEPAVVEAGRAIVGGEIPVLKDPRVQLEFNDARNTLLVDDEKYDVVAAQPSHPWLARAANVFTKDFFTLVHSRLNEGGIYGHWVNLFHMDATTLKSLLKAFYEVFPNGVVFATLETGDLLMFGSEKPVHFDFKRINQRLNEPSIKAALEFHKIYAARDLMEYFAFSREQALTLAGDTQANTDTNIFSEVRLSAMGKKPVAEEDPYTFIRTNYRFHISPYLNNGCEQTLYELATYFLEKDGKDILARHAAAQIADTAPMLAHSIEYEILWSSYDFAAAFDLYYQHEEWPDRTHLQQSLALSDQGRGDEALRVADRVRDEVLRGTLRARVMVEQQRMGELLAVKTKSDAERMWQLTALAQTKPVEAGKEMAEIVRRVSPALPQLRVLATYYGLIRDEEQLSRVARRMVEWEDRELKHMKWHANAAMDAGNLQHAEFLLKRIADVAPEDTDMKQLRKRLAGLDEQVDMKEVSHG